MSTATESKHTPGPWYLLSGSGEVGIEFSYTDEFGNRHSGHVATVDGMRGERMHANASLITAAPALLEALEDVLQLMTDGILVRDTRNDHDPAWAIKQMPLVMALKKADEAIKIAKGESQ